MEFDATTISFCLDVCRFDDWCPAGNLALHQYGERWLAAPRFVRNVAADLRQPPAHVLVVEGPVERVGEPIKDRLRRSLGRKQGPPGHGLEFRQPGFLRGRNIRQGWAAMRASDRIGLDPSGLDLRTDL